MHTDNHVTDTTGTAPGGTVDRVRAAGAAAAVGGVVWGVTSIVSPSTPETNSQVEIWASGVFQLGLLGLLALMWVTHATGQGRVARTVLASEIVALVLAIAWTVPYLFDANRDSTPLLIVLDVFWPLSMLGVIPVGFLVARAGRWPAPVRYLPLVASLLLPAHLAVLALPDDVEMTVVWTYLATAYAACGLAVVRQAPALAGLVRRDEDAPAA